MKLTNVAIAGCAGRMGRELIRAVVDYPDMAVSGASEFPGHKAIGQDAGLIAGVSPLNVVITSDHVQFLRLAKGVIDFTTPAATMENLKRCVQNKIAIVIGTTGITEEHHAEFKKAALSIPVFYSPNMSVGIQVLGSLAKQAAQLLGPDFDIEIVEAHHRHKKDAPSGTALLLAKQLPKQVPIHAVRGGDVVGDHTIMFCGSGERLEFTHRATSRETFARGAVRALRWVVDQSPGFYGMQDMLNNI